MTLPFFAARQVEYEVQRRVRLEVSMLETEPRNVPSTTPSNDGGKYPHTATLTESERMR